jgi:anti-sigma factor RsiW
MGSRLDECEAISELLSAAFDGEATPEEREIVEEHLERCSACRDTQAAAMALRGTLAQASWPLPTDTTRDDELIAMLRRGSLSRLPHVVRLGIAEGMSPPTRLPAGRPAPPGLRERARTDYALIISFIRAQFRRLVENLLSSLRPALLTMAVSFAVAWSALQWAETDATRAPDRNASRPAAAARPVDLDAFEQWLVTGSPAVATPAPFLQPVKAPRRPTLPRRGAMPRGYSYTG